MLHTKQWFHVSFIQYFSLVPCNFQCICMGRHPPRNIARLFHRSDLENMKASLKRWDSGLLTCKHMGLFFGGEGVFLVLNMVLTQCHSLYMFLVLLWCIFLLAATSCHCQSGSLILAFQSLSPHGVPPLSVPETSSSLTMSTSWEQRSRLTGLLSTFVSRDAAKKRYFEIGPIELLHLRQATLLQI